jgi:RNA polymerase sigma-70 factor (ECF subfamily)
MEATDGELARIVATSAAGAPAAEAELCARFAPRIRLYGLKHLRDEDRARDLVQAVLVALLEALRAGRVEDLLHVDRFVLGACRNLSLRARHADTRAVPTEDKELATLSAETPEHDAVDVGALLRCLSSLDLRARTILQLSFYREKTAPEIAAALATSAGNVRVLRHRAMGELRHCLETAPGTVQ